MQTLKELFLVELADIYDAEQRLARAVPKMIKAATCARLKAAFQYHLKETECQVSRLEKVSRLFGEKLEGKKCKATVGLLEEANELAAKFQGSPPVNAALIAAAQKMEHYEIASYGCLHQWAKTLGNQAAAALLEATLSEEKSADDKLTECAHLASNGEAQEGIKPGEIFVKTKSPIPSNRRFSGAIRNLSTR
jgi:ferritin-like metal-binding protein YciE